MSVSINSKREQFRREIIKKQKEEMFMSRRMELISSFITEQRQSNINIVEALKQRTNVNEAFGVLRRQFSDMANSSSSILRYVEEGLIWILISFLQEGVEVAQVLELIGLIVGREVKHFNITGSFFSHGILQYAINNMQDYNCAAFSTYVLCIYTKKSQDYSQILLANGKHRVLMQQFMRRLVISSDPQAQNEKDKNNFYVNILLTLESMLKIKQSTLDFSSEKMEIFEFTLNIASRRLFLKVSLGILYECVLEMHKYVFERILPLVNDLLGETRADHKHVFNLFALIYVIVHKCGPVQLNFKEFYKLGIMAPKVQKPLVHVIDAYISKGAQYTKFIPKNEEWWEELLKNPLNKQIHYMMLHFIDELQIAGEWIWRVFAAALEEPSTDVQYETIIILSKRLHKSQYHEETINLLKKHRIIDILFKLSLHGSTLSVKEAAESLTDYIAGPAMQEELHTV